MIADYPSIISIGIAARNEEKSIRQMLQSLTEAAATIPLSSHIEILIGINGSTDATQAIVTDFIAHFNNKPRPLTFRVLQTPQGKISTQRRLYTAKHAKHSMIMLDADITLGKNSLEALIKAMVRSDVRIAWARPIPIDYKKPAFRTLIYNFADCQPSVVKRGKHFFGRAFAISGYKVPLISPTVKKADIANALWHFLGLSEGPLVDDSYISRFTITKYGPSVMAQPPEAVVYFQPIARLKDFYLSQRRKEYESHRLDILFPEYKTVRKMHFKKTVDPTALAALPFKLKVACRLYLFLYEYLWKIAAIEYRIKILLLKAGAPLPPAIWWPSLSTTKQGFGLEQDDPTIS